jgi:hypothetical protein
MAARTKSYHTGTEAWILDEKGDGKKLRNFSNLAGSLSHRKGNFKRADSQLL